MKDRLFIIAACALTACTGMQPQADAARSAAQTYVYRCQDGYSFTARIDADTAWLFLPGETVDLKRAPSDSGARYGDEAYNILHEGERAQLEAGGVRHDHCINDRRAAIWEHAKLNGADFRGAGNEPGWHLEISQGNRVLLVTDYGQARYSFELAAIRSDSRSRTTTYTAAGSGKRVEVSLTAASCLDTMDNVRYETRVTVVLDGRTLHGCGRALH